MSQQFMQAVDAYRRMAVIRFFERTCLDLSAKELIAGSVHTCLGQEAIPVGTCAALADEDRVVATYRGHGWAIALGVPLDKLLGEICQRADGINGGRGGSAYLTSPRHGLYGENSIVGAGVPIAAGLAMAATRSRTGVVVVSIGDGAMNQGATHEGIVFAAARRLPLIIVCENNGWSEMTPIATMVRAPLSERVAGYGIDSVTVDGCDPLAVETAVREARQRAGNQQGPVFLECKTVRLSGHYNRDIEHYRPKPDLEQAEREEPLARLRRELLDAGQATPDELDEIEAEARAQVTHAVDAALAMPQPDPDTARDHITATHAAAGKAAQPQGTPSTMTYQRAVNAALRAELTDNDDTLVYGEDVGNAGGIFGVTRKLQKDFGPERVFDTPIAESAILGSAVGASMAGLRPIVEVMWADFLLVALDQLINQAANVRYVSRGELHAPMVVRTQQGVTPGSCAQHSQSLEALLAHIPGLKVGLPATPHDAYTMLRAAAADPDPCVLIEARSLYQTEGPVWLDAADQGAGGARFHRTGSDVALVTWGTMLGPCLKAADSLAADGIEASVLDVRWVSPLDHHALSEAVTGSSGKVVVVHEANLTGGFGAEVAAAIQQTHLRKLSSPIMRVAAPDIRMPSAPALQAALVPDVARIVYACRQLLEDRAPSAVGAER